MQAQNLRKIKQVIFLQTLRGALVEMAKNQLLRLLTHITHHTLGQLLNMQLIIRVSRRQTRSWQA